MSSNPGACIKWRHLPSMLQKMFFFFACSEWLITQCCHYHTFTAFLSILFEMSSSCVTSQRAIATILYAPQHTSFHSSMISTFCRATLHEDNFMYQYISSMVSLFPVEGNTTLTGTGSLCFCSSFSVKFDTISRYSHLLLRHLWQHNLVNTLKKSRRVFLKNIAPGLGFENKQPWSVYQVATIFSAK